MELGSGVGIASAATLEMYRVVGRILLDPAPHEF